MKPASLVAAFALSVAAMSAARAQKKTVVGVVGSVFRYDGDTIWMERDTTETRVIYRGDTVIRRHSIDGRILSEITMVLRDGAAWPITSRDSTGTVRPSAPSARPFPLQIAGMERDMLARELQQQEMRARLQGQAMALSLISQMRLSAMQARSALQTAPPPNLPGLASTGCK